LNEPPSIDDAVGEAAAGEIDFVATPTLGDGAVLDGFIGLLGICRCGADLAGDGEIR